MWRARGPKTTNTMGRHWQIVWEGWEPRASSMTASALPLHFISFPGILILNAVLLMSSRNVLPHCYDLQAWCSSYLFSCSGAALDSAGSLGRYRPAGVSRSPGALAISAQSLALPLVLCILSPMKWMAVLCQMSRCSTQAHGAKWPCTRTWAKTNTLPSFSHRFAKEGNPFIILEAGHPRSRCGQNRFLRRPLPALHMPTPFLCPCGILLKCVPLGSLCTSWSSYKDTIQVRVHPDGPISMSSPCENPVSKYSHILRYWTVEF